MSRSRRIVHQLRSKHDRCLEDAMQSLADGDINASKRHMEWAEAIRRLLSMRESGYSVRWTIWIFIISLLLVGLLFTVKVLHTTVSVNLNVNAVEFMLGNDWKVKDLSAKQIRITNVMTYREGGNSEHTDESHDLGTGEVWISGDNVQLGMLKFSDSTVIRLDANDEQLSMYIKNASITGSVSFRNAKVVVTDEYGDEYTRQVDGDSDEIRFRTITNTLNSVPILVDLKWDVSASVDPAQVTSISFEQEEMDGLAGFASTINTGSFTILDTDAEHDVNAPDFLAVKMDGSNMVNITYDNDSFDVRFRGDLAEISGGPQGFMRSYTPSYLEYIYHNNRLELLWTAILFVWGVLWSMRQKLSRWNKS